MNREKIVLRYMAEYSARLGVPAVDVATNRGMFKEMRERIDKRNLGVYHGSHISVNTKAASATGLKNTVIHELIHHSLPNVRHGEQMERCIKAVQSGNIFFSNKGLETKFPKPKPQLNEKVRAIQDHIKKLNSKIKRLNTIRRKWERKEKYYQRKEHEQ